MTPFYTPRSNLRTSGIVPPASWVAALQARHVAEAEASAIVSAYVRFAPQAGLNYDLALAQAALECAWFADWRWTRDRNPAGLGATSRDAPGLQFASIEAGIQAHLAHLCCYVYDAATCPIERGLGWRDPRHSFHDGYERLGDLVRDDRKWASPGTSYAVDICRVVNLVVDHACRPADVEGMTGLVDVRAGLPTSATGGPNETTSRGERAGAVVHYNGPPVDPERDAWQLLIADAWYHVGKDWGQGVRGDGLMYHVAILPSGLGLLCRDPLAVLWHCGHWPENRVALSLMFPLGGQQRATEAQLRTAWRLLREWTAQHPGPVVGHQELSATSCPGTLMDDLIRPYRAGQAPPAGADDDDLIGSTQPGDGSGSEPGETGETAMADGQYFDATGCYVGGGFYAFWRANNGPAVFGYPLTGEYDILSDAPDVQDGRMTIQVFERAVLEYHPLAPAGWTVQVRRLGAEALTVGLIVAPSGVPS